MDVSSSPSKLGTFTLSVGGGTVIKWDKHVLRVHYLEQGLSIAAIARELGVDRRTIHRWKVARRKTNT